MKAELTQDERGVLIEQDDVDVAIDGYVIHIAWSQINEVIDFLIASRDNYIKGNKEPMG